MKKILIISLLLLSLNSCFYDKKETGNTWTGKTMSWNTLTWRTSTWSLIKDPIMERQKESLVKHIKNEDERKIWIDYYKAQDLKDSKKVKEIRSKLDVLEKQKREELTKALKEKNIEKSREIQQYLILFRIERMKK